MGKSNKSRGKYAGCEAFSIPCIWGKRWGANYYKFYFKCLVFKNQRNSIFIIYKKLHSIASSLVTNITISELHSMTRIKFEISRGAVVHLNFKAGSTFPVPVCTVSPSQWVNEAVTH